MSQSCNLIPKRKVSSTSNSTTETQYKDSNLFVEMQSLFRDMSNYHKHRTGNSNVPFLFTRTGLVNTYYAYSNPKLEQQYKRKKLNLDELREPTIFQLFRHTDISDKISTTEIKNMLEWKLNDNNKTSYNSLNEIVRDFNHNSSLSSLFFSSVEYDMESNKYHIKVTEDTKSNRRLEELRRSDKELNAKLRSILESFGISTGALTTLEEKLSISGVTDFNMARTITNGMVELIRLAKGERGELALPEEFSHFIIEAMGDNAIINRLKNLISNNDSIIKEVLGVEYDTYVELYKDNKETLVKEVLGKLLAKHLIYNHRLSTTKSYKNLLTRAINSIKNFFSKFSTSELRKARIEVNDNLSDLSKKILIGEINASTENISTSNIQSNEKLYNATRGAEHTEKELKQRDTILQQAITTLAKKVKMYKNSDKVKQGKSNYIKDLKKQIQELRALQSKNQVLQGVNKFVSDSLEEMSRLSNTINSINFNESSAIEGEEEGTDNSKAAKLRNANNFIASFRKMSKHIRVLILEERLDKNTSEEDKQLLNTIEKSLNVLESEVSTMQTQVQVHSTSLFTRFMESAIGTEIYIPFGKNKGKKMTMKELIEKAERDIPKVSALLSSMANANDYILNSIDTIVKKAKDTARLNTIDFRNRITALQEEYENNTGTSDTSFMYERDFEGNLTGRYISKLNWGEYYKRKNAKIQELRKKYGNPVYDKDGNIKEYSIPFEYEDKIDEELTSWVQDNTVTVNESIRPLDSIYHNSAYDRLTTHQHTYRSGFLNLKSELEEKLPPNKKNLFNSIKIRKDFIEKLQTQNTQEAVYSEMQDAIHRRSDDIEMTADVLIDFEGQEVKSLPLYYLHVGTGESLDEMSQDTSSALLAYAANVYDYAEMDDIIHLLEIGRDVLSRRKIYQTDSDGNIVQEEIDNGGNTITTPALIETSRSNFMARLNKYFDMQVYGQYQAKGKTQKATNTLIKYTALSTLALNLKAAITNVMVGTFQTLIEGASGQFFSFGNLRTAYGIYTTHLAEALAEIGNRTKTNKLDLWLELFNVQQDYEEVIKEQKYRRRSKGSRLSTMSSLFFLSTAGEKTMSATTAIGMAQRYNLQDKNGNKVNLWDAFEVVDSGHGSTKMLKIKDGLTKEDGTAFTKEDISNFSKKVAAVNHGIHGIYDSLGASAIQHTALGRLALLYRKWVAPSANKRWGKAHFNQDTQEWEEGFHRTAFRFINTLRKDLKEHKLNIAATWESLSETEKQNMFRMGMEALLVAILFAVTRLGWDDDDKRKKRSWGSYMLEYSVKRSFMEMAALSPTPFAFTEGFKLIKSPTAATAPIDRAIDLLGLLDLDNWGEEGTIRSGKWKGYSKAEKAMLTNIPGYSTIYSSLHPKDGIAWTMKTK